MDDHPLLGTQETGAGRPAAVIQAVGATPDPSPCPRLALGHLFGRPLSLGHHTWHFLHFLDSKARIFSHFTYLK